MREQEFRDEIGRSMRFLRRAADLTQSDLAGKLGLKSAGFICEIEKGQKTPSAYLLFKIERELGSIWPKPSGHE